MKALQDLDIFIKTAESGSLTATARQLGLTPAATSAALKRLEAELQCQLFVRSTRSLRLTPQGEQFLGSARQALELLDGAREALHSGNQVLRGTLQLSMPSDLGRNVILPWLDEFMARHPEVAIRAQLSDRLADVYRQPVDLAIRYGEPPDSGMIALPLYPANRRVLCASPAYLARHGTPVHPGELTGHNCLCYMLGDSFHDRWWFAEGDRTLTVNVRGNRQADDGDVVRRWALAGLGIAYKSGLDVAADLACGRLVALCPAWQGDPAPLNMMCASRRLLSPAVQALREFLAQRLAEHVAQAQPA
ncbi:LysR family transcriptional regulator [uncultured Aquitalea sp.]|uniref:LysR family transcriptional regulator n=1 Tax=uncultured Aquitalea sp. TaxID=540272 RepID=UPI0025DFCAFC|nr:LysR family transcriptional regulator [uncultured Aquitalea sp.]